MLGHLLVEYLRKAVSYVTHLVRPRAIDAPNTLATTQTDHPDKPAKQIAFRRNMAGQYIIVDEDGNQLWNCQEQGPKSEAPKVIGLKIEHTGPDQPGYLVLRFEIPAGVRLEESTS
jgi:hypothetical protein